jgi:hypothetical protein
VQVEGASDLGDRCGETEGQQLGLSAAHRRCLLGLGVEHSQRDGPALVDQCRIARDLACRDRAIDRPGRPVEQT